MGVTHLALELGPWHQRRDGVDDSTSMAPDRTSVSAISRACSPASGCEISSSSISTPSCGHRRVERMLGIDEGTVAAFLLRLGNTKGQSGLAEDPDRKSR